MRKKDGSPANVVEIVTPKKYVLNGLWFGPKRPKRVIIWLHGMGSSLFSKLSIAQRIVDKNTAVLAFNNRGHAIVSRLRNIKRDRSIRAGTAHERFIDCVDDIQGAVNFVRRQGVGNIFLAGHSTGCQKAIYWASRTGGRGVKGVILLAPTSDWWGETMLRGARKIAKVAAVARVLVRRGKEHELLPSSVWHEVLDAQRFLSLYSLDGAEEIFSYAQPKKNPRALKSVRIPILVLWAGREEFSDKPAREIKKWFEKHLRKGKVVIIPRVRHSFRGGERVVAREIRRFIAG